MLFSGTIFNKPYFSNKTSGKTITEYKIAEELMEIIKKVANGKQTNNKKNSREIAIFKDGVTL